GRFLSFHERSWAGKGGGGMLVPRRPWRLNAPARRFIPATGKAYRPVASPNRRGALCAPGRENVHVRPPRSWSVRPIPAAYKFMFSGTLVAPVSGRPKAGRTPLTTERLDRMKNKLALSLLMGAFVIPIAGH